jgi:hypothetical protein
MPMTYGPCFIMTPTPDVAWAVDAAMPLIDLYEFERSQYPEFEASHRAFRPRQPCWPRLNRLHWPRGASAWASFHFLVDATDLGILRPMVYSQGKYTPLPLVLNDTTNSITAKMWMLPPRPIVQIPGLNDLSLVTLVDDRYFWWMQAANIAVTGGTTAWTDLYASIGAALGVTIAVDMIPAAYLKPSADFAASYEYLPVLLDAVAMSCGQRIVRTLDGKVLAQNATTAAANAKKQFAVNYRQQAGGQFALDPLVQPSDLRALVPANVTATYPRSDSGVVGTDFTPYTVSLTSLTLTEFRQVTGYNGAKVFHSNTIAAWTGGGSPTNDAELTALTAQLATDWYRWQLGKLDVKFAAVVPWVPEGLHDVSWVWSVGELSTHVSRGPWNDQVERIGVHGTDGAVDYSVVNLFTGLPAITSITGDSGPPQTGPGITLTGGTGISTAGAGNVITITNEGVTGITIDGVTIADSDVFLAWDGAGSDFTISIAGDTVTFHWPSASDLVRGLIDPSLNPQYLYRNLVIRAASGSDLLTGVIASGIGFFNYRVGNHSAYVGTVEDVTKYSQMAMQAGASILGVSIATPIGLVGWGVLEFDDALWGIGPYPVMSFVVRANDLSYKRGLWGTGGAGDTFCGGIVTAFGTTTGTGATVHAIAPSLTGQVTITASGAANTPLLLTPFAGQAAPLLKAGSGTAISGIDANGYLFSQETTVPTVASGTRVTGPFVLVD